MKLLVITIAFPPSSHANAKRPYYLVKGFLEAGWEVDVITSHLDRFCGSQEVVDNPKCSVNCVADPLERIRARFNPSGKIFKFLSLVTQGVFWPDGFALWALRVFWQMRRSGKHYDHVIAFVFPPSIYLASWFSGMIGMRWTFDLQESVTPQYALIPKRSPFHRLLAPLLVKLERQALHKAGHVVFTSATNQLEYVRQGLVKEEFTSHVPYFFDTFIFEDLTPFVSKEFHIVYYGTFDWQGCRSPETFLRAFSCFLEMNPEAKSVARFIFFGNWQSIHDEIIEELKLRDYIEINNPISYSEYLEKIKRSPILLLIVSPMHNLFMPSKIVDYLGSRRPILALVPIESEVRNVLEKAGMTQYTSNVDDVSGASNAITALWKCYKHDKLGSVDSKIEEWSSKKQIARYIDILSLR